MHFIARLLFGMPEGSLSEGWKASTRNPQHSQLKAPMPSPARRASPSCSPRHRHRRRRRRRCRRCGRRPRRQGRDKRSRSSQDEERSNSPSSAILFPGLLQYAAGFLSRDDAHDSSPAPCSSRKPSGKPSRLPLQKTKSAQNESPDLHFTTSSEFHNNGFLFP